MRNRDFFVLSSLTMLVLVSGWLAFAGNATASQSLLQREGPSEPDCGPAALYVLCKSQQVPASLAMLKKQTLLNRTGTNLMSLKVAALQLGFQAEGRRLSAEQLHQQLTSGTTAILHLPGRQHFITVIGTQPGYFQVVDPAMGGAYWSLSQLASEGWKGHALVLTR